MRADHALSTRRVSVLALAAVVLTTLAALACAMTQSDSSATHHLHAVRAAGFVTSDQGSSTVRIDQPAVSVHSAPVPAAAQIASDQAATGAAEFQTAVDAPTPRGPPAGP